VVQKYVHMHVHVNQTDYRFCVGVGKALGVCVYRPLLHLKVKFWVCVCVVQC
jgi:hypothetical protein